MVGTLRDSSGGTVADGTVTLLNTETGVSVTKTSNPEGHYEFITVRPGTYVVTAEKPGFAIVLVDGVIVQVGARLRVDILNHTNFTAPNANRSLSNFGTITQTFDARQVQLGMKVLW